MTFFGTSVMIKIKDHKKSFIKEIVKTHYLRTISLRNATNLFEILFYKKGFLDMG